MPRSKSPASTHRGARSRRHRDADTSRYRLSADGRDRFGRGGARRRAAAGSYTVRIELAGFATVVEEGRRRARGPGRAPRRDHEGGPTRETVNVVGQASLVDIFKTDSSTNIVPEQIEALPVQDRDFQRLAFLTPGFSASAAEIASSATARSRAAGNASQATIMVDGVDFTDPALGLARARFSQDAISEFRVIANRFDSEIGGSAGGALSIVTKSGTDDVKGSAFSLTQMPM